MSRPGAVYKPRQRCPHPGRSHQVGVVFEGYGEARHYDPSYPNTEALDRSGHPVRVSARLVKGLPAVDKILQHWRR